MVYFVKLSIGPDGRYHCVSCKKAFHKERHYITHKCIANTDYVDITGKEAIAGEGLWDASPGEEDDELADSSVDFRLVAMSALIIPCCIQTYLVERKKY